MFKKSQIELFQCVCQVSYLKSIEEWILRGVETRLIRSVLVNWRPANFLFLNFKKTLSQKKHKTIFSSSKINAMALSDQIDFMELFVSVRWLTVTSSIPEYDNPLQPLPH